MNSTIAAIATPLGMGGMAVIRISGEKAKNILQKLIKKPRKTIASHKVYHGWIPDIDEVVYIYMKAPGSFTGEDTVEITCHGGIRIAKRILEGAISAGARQADRGEFSKRAFLNGKIDLSKAEAIISIIQAQTDVGIEAAEKQLSGRLGQAIEKIREELLAIGAEIEASIDFPEDIEIGRKGIKKKIGEVIIKINKLLATADYGAIIRNGVRMAIIGKPNVGKSSLLNMLIKHDRAIVSDEPGTTRDTIEEAINICGLPVVITDTAGIREPKSRVERLGVERSKEEIKRAEIILLVLDASQKKMTDEDKELLKASEGKKRIFVLNKKDLGIKLKAEGVAISALKGEGIERLEKAIYRSIAPEGRGMRDGIIVINARHKQCLMRAKECLQRASDSIKIKGENELQSIDIKEAAESLGEISGLGVTEEIIDKIFAEFCIGK